MSDRSTSFDGMQLDEVLAVLAGLHKAGCHYWVGGGWGVDALVRQQTRQHRDLDLATASAAPSSPSTDSATPT